LGQKFLVTKQSLLKNDELIFRFVADKSRDEEYFLDICDSKGKSLRMIPVADIEQIEPVQGTKFLLQYNQNPPGSNIPILGKKIAERKGKIFREEEYQSRHIAELKDAFD
jgi:hypothetical protein